MSTKIITSGAHLHRRCKENPKESPERQTAAVGNEVKASSKQKREKKKKLEARSKRGKAKTASTNPMAIPSKKIKIAGDGLRLSDGKKVPEDIASKKKAVQQTTANNLLANGGSARTR